MAKPEVKEHLNSPVDDPGYWPYPKRSGGLQETVTSVEEPADPAGLVPASRKHRKEGED